MRGGHRSAAQLLIAPVPEGANNRNPGRAQVHRMAPIIGKPGEVVPAIRCRHGNYIRQIVRRGVYAVDVVIAAVPISIAVPCRCDEQDPQLHLRLNGVVQRPAVESSSPTIVSSNDVNAVFLEPRHVVQALDSP